MAGLSDSVLQIKESERKEAGCQHRLFFSQVEYCDNLIFHRRAALDQLGQRLLDANRTIGQPNKITMIFGRKVTKQYKGKLQTVIEDLELANPVIRSHYASGFVKQYTFVDRGQLRKLTEPTVLPSGKRIPGLRLDHPRQLALMHALVRFTHIAAGGTFTTAELYPFGTIFRN